MVEPAVVFSCACRVRAATLPFCPASSVCLSDAAIAPLLTRSLTASLKAVWRVSMPTKLRPHAHAAAPQADRPLAPHAAVENVVSGRRVPLYEFAQQGLRLHPRPGSWIVWEAEMGAELTLECLEFTYMYMYTSTRTNTHTHAPRPALNPTSGMVSAPLQPARRRPTARWTCAIPRAGGGWEPYRRPEPGAERGLEGGWRLDDGAEAVGGRGNTEWAADAGKREGCARARASLRTRRPCPRPAHAPAAVQRTFKESATCYPR